MVTAQAVIYPESDGKPIADNTKQLEYIFTIKSGLDALFHSEPNVFVAADLLWYPVQGLPRINAAPDVMVAFGRPQGHRRSYLQWQEDNVPPQVVFEILSESNTAREMSRKLTFYQTHGVEEYYLYDPDAGTLDGWQRQGEQLIEIEQMQGWSSTRLGVRFELIEGELALFRPDGSRFATYLELIEQRDQERQARIEAEQDAEQALQRALVAEQRAEALAARLRALGIDPDEVANA